VHHDRLASRSFDLLARYIGLIHMISIVDDAVSALLGETLRDSLADP
jgi:hypothetical protein